MKRFISLILVILMATLVVAMGPRAGEGPVGEDIDPAMIDPTMIDPTMIDPTMIEGPGMHPVEDEIVRSNKEVMSANKEAPKPVLISAKLSEESTEKIAQVRARIEARRAEMTKEAQNLSFEMREMVQNQNRVRLAVHSLLEMKESMGGLGPKVSEIAKEFNNSIQNTFKAEEHVRERSGIARFFAGGDAEAAQEIEQEVTRNRERIQELKQVVVANEIGEEVRSMMQEQIQNMEQEQERLQQLAQKEKQKKGLFGWIWK